MNTVRLEIENRKGLKLQAYLELPANQKPNHFAIFAHCFSCNSNFNAVKNISRSLSNHGFGVLRFDFTGLGKSEGEFTESHFSANVDDLIDVNNYLAKHYKAPELLVGHSLGGYIALAFAEKHPQKVKGLCLMNATSNEDTSERKALRLRANKMITSNFRNMVRISFANLFGPKSKTFFKKEIELAVSEALLTPMQGYIAAQEGMQLRANRNHVLTDNSFKKLLIIGKKDPVLDFETSLNEAKKTNSAIVVFQNGHMPHIENKLALNDTLKEFMKIC